MSNRTGRSLKWVCQGHQNKSLSELKLHRSFQRNLRSPQHATSLRRRVGVKVAPSRRSDSIRMGTMFGHRYAASWRRAAQPKEKNIEHTCTILFPLPNSNLSQFIATTAMTVNHLILSSALLVAIHLWNFIDYLLSFRLTRSQARYWSDCWLSKLGRVSNDADFPITGSRTVRRSLKPKHSTINHSYYPYAHGLLLDARRVFRELRHNNTYLSRLKFPETCSTLNGTTVKLTKHWNWGMIIACYAVKRSRLLRFALANQFCFKSRRTTVRKF